MIRVGCVTVAAGLVLAASPVAAQEAPRRAASFDQLVACRKVTSDTERLSCFDRAVASLDQAVSSKEVAVVDRQEVRAAKRSLFGIALPNLKLFDDKDDAEPVQEISSTIRAVQPDVLRHFTFRLADGGTWQTIETAPVVPEVGNTIVIRRAALGSYLAKIQGARGVRVQRLR